MYNINTNVPFPLFSALEVWACQSSCIIRSIASLSGLKSMQYSSRHHFSRPSLCFLPPLSQAITNFLLSRVLSHEVETAVENGAKESRLGSRGSVGSNAGQSRLGTSSSSVDLNPVQNRLGSRGSVGLNSVQNRLGSRGSVESKAGQVRWSDNKGNDDKSMAQGLTVNKHRATTAATTATNGSVASIATVGVDDWIDDGLSPHVHSSIMFRTPACSRCTCDFYLYFISPCFLCVWCSVFPSVDLVSFWVRRHPRRVSVTCCTVGVHQDNKCN